MSRKLIVLALCIGSFALGMVLQRYSDSKRLNTQLALPRVLSYPGTSLRDDSVASQRAPIHFNQEPLWAYGFDRPAAPGDTALPQSPPTRNLRPNEDSTEQTRPRHIAGSDATFSLVDVRDGHNVIDWFPGDHPPMPNVVAHGPAAMGTAARGCGSCHLPNGKGRPENAGIAGLPVAYFVRQIEDFRSGRRRSADPRKPNTYTMMHLASAMSDDELTAAAEYFGSLQSTPWIRVVETDLVPKTRIAGNLFLPLERAKTERIAGRIIETPEDEAQSETYRNPRGIRRLRPHRKHREREGSCDDGRQRQDGAVHHLSRTGSHGGGGHPADRGQIAELYRATVVGHPTGHSQQRAGAVDAARRRKSD